jgi:hypothetical protein
LWNDSGREENQSPINLPRKELLLLFQRLQDNLRQSSAKIRKQVALTR